LRFSLNQGARDGLLWPVSRVSQCYFMRNGGENVDPARVFLRNKLKFSKLLFSLLFRKFHSFLYFLRNVDFRAPGACLERRREACSHLRGEEGGLFSPSRRGEEEARSPCNRPAFRPGVRKMRNTRV